MRISRVQEVLFFKDVVSLDGIDTDVAVKLEVNYEKGGFKVKPVLHSKHGFTDEFKEVLEGLIQEAFAQGEKKMDAYRQENGIGKQTDLFEGAGAGG